MRRFAAAERRQEQPEAMTDIRPALRRYIEDNFLLGASTVVLRDADSFLDHHVLDSTGFLELIAHLEESYSIKVADDEMVPENLDSIDAIAAYVARKQS